MTIGTSVSPHPSGIGVSEDVERRSLGEFHAGADRCHLEKRIKMAALGEPKWSVFTIFYRQISKRSHGHRREKDSTRFTVLSVGYIGIGVREPDLVPRKPQCLAKPQPRVAEHDQERRKFLVDLFRLAMERVELLGPKPGSLFISCSAFRTPQIEPYASHATDCANGRVDLSIASATRSCRIQNNC